MITEIKRELIGSKCLDSVQIDYTSDVLVKVSNVESPLNPLARTTITTNDIE